MNCGTTCASIEKAIPEAMKKQIILLLLIIPSLASAQVPIPELWGARVHDDAKILNAAFVSELELLLKAHEDSTSNQIAILIIPALNDVPVEDYTFRVAENWKLGTEEKDNGVLLFVAVKDRKVRIEVGEGLEGVLPDAIGNQIIRNEIAPNFRQQNYEAGIRAGVQAVIQAIGGEYQAEHGPVTRRKGRGGSLWGTLIVLAIIILISRIGGGGRGNRRGGWSSGAGWYGGGFSGRGGGSGGGFGGGFSGGGGGFSGGGASGSW
jgi:uncharacterized protein